MANEFGKLCVAARLIGPGTHHNLMVDEWKAKRDILNVQLADLPGMASAHKTRQHRPYSADPRMKLVDATPTVRLANACEATANGLYSMAEVAANFANKASRGEIPSSFNSIRKKCEANPDSALSQVLRDLQWYRKVRELRTEWAHFSTIFVAEAGDGEPLLCVRAYRRASDLREFQGDNFQCTVAEFALWVTKAIETIDRFAGYLLDKHVLPHMDLDATFTDVKRDANGWPIMLPDCFRFDVETITVREYLHRSGVVPRPNDGRLCT